MANKALLGTYADSSESPLIFRNKLINGGFDIWQRGTTQTGVSYGSDDRWLNDNQGSSKTHSRQSFTVGQTDVPGNPAFFSRTAATSALTVSSYVFKEQRIESVRTLAGQVAVFSFWAKADSSKNMAIEFIQDFGTGGSPSTRITAIGVTTIPLTTSWQKFTVAVSIPSISGKVLGTNNDDYLSARFWFDAGSNFNARTNSLGSQSGTFDIANVQLEAGNSATPFEQRPVGLELALCQRYYAVTQTQHCITTEFGRFLVNPPVVNMRTAPIITISTLYNGESGVVLGTEVAATSSGTSGGAYTATGYGNLLWRGGSFIRYYAEL